jgi:hypothetical protein
MSSNRRDEITAAVEAYNQANPTARLPRSAARLLGVMFAEADVCRLSQQDLMARGFGGTLFKVLHALVDAGFMTKQAGAARFPDTYRLNSPMGRQP